MSSFDYKKKEPESIWGLHSVGLPVAYLCTEAAVYFSLVVFLDLLNVRPKFAQQFYSQMDKLKRILCFWKSERTSAHRSSVIRTGSNFESSTPVTSKKRLQNFQTPPTTTTAGLSPTNPIGIHDKSSSLDGELISSEITEGGTRTVRRPEQNETADDERKTWISDLNLNWVFHRWNRMSSVRQGQSDQAISTTLEANSASIRHRTGRKSDLMNSKNDVHDPDAPRGSILSNLFCVLSSPSLYDDDEDEDVREERLRLEENERRRRCYKKRRESTPELMGWFPFGESKLCESLGSEDDVESCSQPELLIVKGLRKVFEPATKKQREPKVAVRNLWFAVPRGQCLG